ncbi:4-hydroxy-tetrahydrodipicolinate reductase [Buchnera aphidicola]|uniref:4-hydroxy-tetrahydrodipicolinate reductase n=1 Tax=Buchnera aphidicola TaxID=9 RepID=UPI0031B812C3
MNKKKIKIAISGAIGRMGKMIIKNLIKKKKKYLSVLLTKKKNKKTKKKIINLIGKKKFKKIIFSDSINKVNQYFNILIDFSTPKNTIKNIENCILNKKKIVIGTTGFNKKEKKKIYEAKKKISILKSSNFSIGINLLLNTLKKITKKIGKISDIEIIEKHHNKKKDSPSGTSIEIGKTITKTMNIKLKNNAVYTRYGYIKKRKKNTIGFSAIRAGNIIGEHKIIFAIKGEIIELTHKAINRKIFSSGAILGAKWLYNKKPGIYNMKDVLKNIKFNK